MTIQFPHVKQKSRRRQNLRKKNETLPKNPLISRVNCDEPPKPEPTLPRAIKKANKRSEKMGINQTVRERELALTHKSKLSRISWKIGAKLLSLNSKSRTTENKNDNI